MKVLFSRLNRTEDRPNTTKLTKKGLSWGKTDQVVGKIIYKIVLLGILKTLNIIKIHF